jgi:hypothetical protein
MTQVASTLKNRYSRVRTILLILSLFGVSTQTTPVLCVYSSDTQFQRGYAKMGRGTPPKVQKCILLSSTQTITQSPQCCNWLRTEEVLSSLVSKRGGSSMILVWWIISP